jgi:signal transduction histidine kinase
MRCCTIGVVTPVMTSWGKVARLAAASVVLVLALGAVAVARGPGRFTTYAGRSDLAATLTVAAGLALALAGLSTLLTRRRQPIGDLALVAALLWFARVFVGWQVGPPLVRSFAMLLAGLSFPLLFHMVFASPTGRLRSTVARAFVYAVYAEAALTALGLALFRDPYVDPNCWANCTDNVFLLRSLPGLAERIAVTDRWFTAAASAALMLACGRRLFTEPGPNRRVQFAVVLPAILLAGAIIAHAIALQRVPREDPSNSVSLMIFDIESAAVVFLAGGLASVAVRTIVQRHAVARIVKSVGEVPLPGSLESGLRRALGDAELRIAYWLPESRRYVDASGRQLDQPVAAPGRTMTTLVQGDEPIAVVSHTAGISELEREIGAAVRLGLENERLQSELLFQLDELQASRTRIIEKGDAERRRLERDLHDGAQQQLLALSYDIRLARATAAANADVQTGSAMEDAMGLAQSCLTELRELAHGIYPAILTEAGVGPALVTFADGAPLPVEIHDSTRDRLSPAVETAAYILVAGAVEDAADRGARFAKASLSSTEERLIVSIEDDGAGPRSSIDRLADRVGAVGGSLIVEATRLRAELPCA